MTDVTPQEIEEFRKAVQYFEPAISALQNLHRAMADEEGGPHAYGYLEEWISRLQEDESDARSQLQDMDEQQQPEIQDTSAHLDGEDDEAEDEDEA